MSGLSTNPTPTPNPTPALTPTSVTGVQLMQGLGVQPAKGFWADAWQTVLGRNTARVALAWLAFIALIAIIGPFIASGHPILFTQTVDGVSKTSSPLIENLKPSDVMLGLGLVAGLVFWFAARRWAPSKRLAAIVAVAIACGMMTVLGSAAFSYIRTSDTLTVPRNGVEIPMVSALRGPDTFPIRFAIALGAGLIGTGVLFYFFPLQSRATRVGIAFGGLIITSLVSASWWERPLQTFEYRNQVAMGSAKAIFTLVPFSPNERNVRGNILAPNRSISQTRHDPKAPPVAGEPRYWLGTDSQGQDVLSQMIHACRLSVSIGLVSTGIAIAIGVTLGAIMGYFGGWVDLLLYRVVEIFMALPVLFLLIVAAAVLPKSAYVMMIVIGCVSWTGAARFTRAEFMRLRNQDFVQAAKACGLPLHSILFRHMLPNGVTPVLVDSSFTIAAAIIIEATLSYLGLGPEEQASWGKLLSDSSSNVGIILWWLAIFPGLAIFLTALSYNVLGESLRDAIDPKLKKARV